MMGLELSNSALYFKMISIAVLLIVVSACSVAPWERGNLARQDMLITPNPAYSSLRAHVFESKESTFGGMGGAGGGCGCN